MYELSLSFQLTKGSPILKWPQQSMLPVKEDVLMKDGENENQKVKGKGREYPVISPNRVLEVMPLHIPAPKGPPKFKIKLKSAAENQKVHQYKYMTEIMNDTSQEVVFQKLLAQLVTLRLGDILGTSYELGKRFQTATRSQRYPIQQVMAAYIAAIQDERSGDEFVESDANDEGENDEDNTIYPCSTEFNVRSGEASSSSLLMEDWHDWNYQKMMEQEYENQLTTPMREVNLA